MRRQSGGAVQYTIRRLTSPEEIERYFRSRKANKLPVPIPAQTFGTCGIDSLITVLFYADEVRLWVWEWVFTNYVKALGPERYGIIVPDEALLPTELAETPGGYDPVLTTRRVNAFLATSAARVLRILEDEPDTATTSRAVSRGRTPEMHGSAPGEICSTLALLVARPGARVAREPPLRVEGAADYGFSAEEEAYAVQLISNVMGKMWTSRDGKGAMALSRNSEDAKKNDIVAIGTTLRDSVNSKDPIMDQGVGVESHAVTLIRHNGAWCVSDDNIGVLLEIFPRIPGLVIDSKLLAVCFLELLIEKKPGQENATAIFTLRYKSNWESNLASTRETPFFDPDFLSRPRRVVWRENTGLIGGPIPVYEIPGIFSILSRLEPLEERGRIDIEPAVEFLRRYGFVVPAAPKDGELGALEKISLAIANGKLRAIDGNTGRYFLFIRLGAAVHRERKAAILKSKAPGAAGAGGPYPAAAGAGGPSGGRRRYSRRVRQWRRRKGAASSTRRRR